MRLSLLAALLLATLSVHAAEPAAPAAGLRAVDAASFAPVAAAVVKELEPGGLYGKLAASDKERVRNRLDVMAKLFAGTSTVDTMSKQDKVRLINAQEQINEILLGTARGRVTCEQRAPTGTRVHSTECRPTDELEAFRRDSTRFLSDTQQRAMQNNAGGRGPDGH